MAASPVIQPGDEFVEATGYNRDYAAMLLRGCGRDRVQSTGIGTSARLARRLAERIRESGYGVSVTNAA